MANRKWRHIQEARAFVRSLGLKNRQEWRAYVKSGRKPHDIPSDPRREYGVAFTGMGDWLGPGRWRLKDAGIAHSQMLVSSYGG